jgi:hypothetical protein
LIINYDLPLKFTVEYTHGREPELDCEVYLYRVGRAGRFGRKGKFLKLFAWLCCVVTFCLVLCCELFAWLCYVVNCQP